MKWEYELMRDMLERATLYLSVPTENNHKTGAMLRQAATVMSEWDRRIIRAEAWAAKLEQQMRREGWVDADFADLREGLGLQEWGQD